MGIFEYIYQWAGRILTRAPKDVGGIYQKLQFSGVETYILTKIRGKALLIQQHLNLTHRGQDAQYNFNTLGLARHAVPQFAKDGALKGATVTLITNGGAFSTLEFLPNVQAAPNALQRLTEQKRNAIQNTARIIPSQLIPIQQETKQR